MKKFTLILGIIGLLNSLCAYLWRLEAPKPTIPENPTCDAAMKWCDTMAYEFGINPSDYLRYKEDIRLRNFSNRHDKGGISYRFVTLFAKYEHDPEHSPAFQDLVLDGKELHQFSFALAFK